MAKLRPAAPPAAAAILVLLAIASFAAAACDDQTVAARRPATLITSTATIAPPDDTTIIIKKLEFHPQRLTVDAGSNVLWINEDGTQHIIRDEDNAWRVGILGPGGAGSFTFENPGRHTYTCSVHPSMKGTLIVH
jgi:plastocyanin